MTSSSEPRVNAALGLPSHDMESFILAVDVDGTLISNDPEAKKREKSVVTGRYDREVLHPHILQLLVIFSTFKNVQVCVWSARGKEYAAQWGGRLHLDKYVWRYASKYEHEEIAKHGKIIAIDDIHDTALGEANLIVRFK